MIRIDIVQQTKVVLMMIIRYTQQHRVHNLLVNILLQISHKKTQTTNKLNKIKDVPACASE